ncbi:MAG: papain-like cysteine protease family protein [Ignavibacteriales bacterium]
MFLLVKDANCIPEDKTITGDSGGKSKPRTSRLPNQEDLINSDEFSQDLAAGTCVNLTTPNRTLSETTYSAIVRTSEPDVANYVLEKNVSFDAADPLNYDKNKVTFTLTDGQRVERQPVDLDNPIRWQDAPDANSNLSFCQAVQVAHGHLLRYKTVWKADGYSLGDLLYSLPLAPGQKKQIVINELKRTLQGTQQQQLIQREGLNASIINDRSIIDSLSGSINESLRGRSSASTGGVSAGLGIGFIAGAVGGVLGVSGGFANASSTASQDSARTTTQSFSEVLRNSISQSANAYRELNGTIIETVTEGQQYSTTSEVIANHNHCHSLTMLYFEVLRHYAVYQELVQVEECLFVPLLMTYFSTENIYKWRDVLAANLLTLPSATYLQPSITLGTGLQHPLIKAFDAIERIITKYSNVDYPEGAFDDEPIREVIGEMNVRINFGRPKTRYDRIKSWPLVKEDDTHHLWALVGGLLAGPLGLGVGEIFDSDGNIKIGVQKVIDEYIEVNANYARVPPAQSIRVINIDEFFFDNDETSLKAWTSYANLLGYGTVYDLLNEFFKNQLVSDWDSIFYDTIAPMLVKKLADDMRLSPFNTDFTALGKYRGGEQVIRFNFRGTTNLTRRLITQVDLVMNSSQTIASDLTTIIAENISIRYATNHYNGTIFSGYLGNDLSSNDTVTKDTPESADEKRNPRKEDIFIVNALISHLNSNLEYYNKVLWYTLDPNRRYLLLDGFNIEVFNDLIGGIVNKSLASVVKNELIGIAGNSLIFPVAAGVKLDRQNIIIRPPDVEGDTTPSQSELNLFEHYKPLTPTPPYRISVPTRGVYAEAIQGACDACEKVKVDTSQDWDKFKPDEPTAINPVTVGVPTATEFKPQFKDFATPIVNIQNAPAAPAPGAGLAGLSDLLGKAGIFKDITGLDANQQNALKTYLSNQENAKAFAEMAKEMSMQGHNTEHADKIADAVRNSPELSKEEKAQLLKDHFGQMIDGGQSKKAEQQNTQNSKPSLTDAAVKAAAQGKSVEAENADINTGKSEKLKIENKPNPFGFKIENVPFVAQEKVNDCWAAVATMMVSWQDNRTTPYAIPEVLAKAGQEYVDKFQNGDQPLFGSEKEDFITALKMVGVPPAESEKFTLESYMQLLKKYGPLWITTDSDPSKSFSPHARILIGYEEEKGDNTQLIFLDPASKEGKPLREVYRTFFESVKAMNTDSPPGTNFIQVVRFAGKDDVGEGAAPMSPFPSPSFTGFNDPLTADPRLWDAFNAAINTVASDARYDHLPDVHDIPLAIVSLNADGTCPLVGQHHSDEMFFSGSLLKVAAMYAAFQLRAAVNDLAARLDPAKIDTPEKLFNTIKETFDRQIKDVVPLINKEKLRDEMRIPKYKRIFTATRKVDDLGHFTGFTLDFKAKGGDLKTDFAGHLRKMIVDSVDNSAGFCIQALGYSWINGLMQKAGFFDPSTNTGIWLAGDYVLLDGQESAGEDPASALGLSQWPVVRIPSENDKEVMQVTTCIDMARLFVLLHDGRLVKDTPPFDHPDTGNEKMLELLRLGVSGDAPSLIGRAHPTFTIRQSKIGVGPLKRDPHPPHLAGNCITNKGCVCSEALIVEEHSAKMRQFVAIFQHLLDATELDFQRIADIIQKTMDNYP